MNKNKKIITWALFFLASFAILQFFTKKQSTEPQELAKTPVAIEAMKTEYTSEEEVIVKIRNNTESKITLPSNCPKNPLKVFAWTGEKFEEKVVETKIDCALSPDIVIDPNSDKTVSYKYWNHSLFSNPGKYKVELAWNTGTTTLAASSPEFTVAEAGYFRKLFRTIFYQPIYNTLVFFIGVAPLHDLGIAIILLTILIRLILLVPSQRAIVSQRRMQELQPKLESVKKKYAGNQERIAAETMQLWKEHKVNPFGSCLPLIIQFPVLIALFYVISNGLNPDNSYLIYSPLKNIDFTLIRTNFFGILELTKMNTFVLPLIVGLLQFFQFKLSMLKKTAASGSDGPSIGKSSEMQTANKMMAYVMPVMIAFFTASTPAGVGLYWGVSTLFGLVQQVIANRKSTL